MAKSKHSYEKRRRELEKSKKKEEKRLRKLEKKNAPEIDVAVPDQEQEVLLDKRLS